MFIHCTVKGVGDEGMRKRSAGGATAAAVHPRGLGKRHMKSLISHLLIGKRCCAKPFIVA